MSTQPTADPYIRLLEAKAPVSIERGITVPIKALNPNLKPHARDIARWMIAGGARACFLSFGLAKTSIQLQVIEAILLAVDGCGLIVCPLGVKHEFVEESAARGFKLTPLYVRTQALQPEELKGMRMDDIRTLWRNYSGKNVYKFDTHVAAAHEMEKLGILPAEFMALEVVNPGSEHVWDDITRMRTLNADQVRKGWEQHVCPLQIDIVDRLIERYSEPGDVVADMFGGIGTVAYEAILKGRKAVTIELNAGYHKCAVSYCRAAEEKVSMPTLFDMMEVPSGGR